MKDAELFNKIRQRQRMRQCMEAYETEIRKVIPSEEQLAVLGFMQEFAGVHVPQSPT